MNADRRRQDAQTLAPGSDEVPLAVADAGHGERRGLPADGSFARLGNMHGCFDGYTDDELARFCLCSRRDPDDRTRQRLPSPVAVAASRSTGTRRCRRA